jgi:N-carbamoyl-L-amino-acid hydrolase
MAIDYFRVGQRLRAHRMGAGLSPDEAAVRNENGSHNPYEHMKISDFMAGVAVMRQVLREAVQ